MKGRCQVPLAKANFNKWQLSKSSTIHDKASKCRYGKGLSVQGTRFISKADIQRSIATEIHYIKINSRKYIMQIKAKITFGKKMCKNIFVSARRQENCSVAEAAFTAN